MEKKDEKKNNKNYTENPSVGSSAKWLLKYILFYEEIIF
jgi:hypothetical protein